MRTKNVKCPAEGKPQDFVYLGIFVPVDRQEGVGGIPLWRCTSCDIIVACL